jgi:hypothetical protein
MMRTAVFIAVMPALVASSHVCSPRTLGGG